MGEEVDIYQISAHMYIQLLITKVTLQGRGSVANAERKYCGMIGCFDKDEVLALRSEGSLGGCRL